MMFRRAAIEAVGGFDETFIYQHEETDLCIRLIRAGYRIVHHPRAVVDHFPALSHFRRDAYDRARACLERHQDKLRKLAEQLVEREQVDAVEVARLIGGSAP